MFFSKLSLTFKKKMYGRLTNSPRAILKISVEITLRAALLQEDFRQLKCFQSAGFLSPIFITPRSPSKSRILFMELEMFNL